jgi:tetratricopeptide (TPR) repeat protein
MSNNQTDETDKPASDALETAERSKLSFDDLGKFLFGAAAWGRIYSNVTLRRMATEFFRNLYNFLAKLPWVAAIIIIAAIFFRGLTEHVTVIQALSVPETLQKNGYTPEVAGDHLRDALQEFVKSVSTHMASPDIALHGELPDIVVPTVGISLDAVMSAIRTLLRSTRSRTISGEFIAEGNELRLRLDGRQIYTSKKNAGLSDPDDLLKLAAPEVLKEIQPYFVAALLSNSNPDEALDMIEDITTQRSDTDENVAWSYNLKSLILSDRKDYPAATAAVNKAIALNPDLAVAYVNLGHILVDQGLTQQGIDEYRKALKIEPKFATVHNNLGVALEVMHQNDEAMKQYQEAVKDDRKFALPHVNIGALLFKAGKTDDSIGEFRRAINLDPMNAEAHNNLGFALYGIGNKDKAVAEYREALKNDPNLVMAHNNLGFALLDMGLKQDAVAEFQAVLKIDPNDSSALSGLKKSSEPAKIGQ